MGPAKAAEQRFSVTTSGGITAVDNPFLSTSNRASAMLSEITVSPVLTSKSERYALELSGNLGHRRYSKDYGSYLFGSALLSASLRQSERLSVQGSAHYRHEVSAEVIDDSAAVSDPRSVRRSFGANGSAVWRASEVSTLTPSASFERVSYDRTDQLSGYDRFSGSLAYTRRLSERTSVGLNTSAMFYEHRNDPDVSVYSAAGTLTHQFSEILNLQASLGLEQVRSSDDLGGKSSKIMASGNANICRRGERTNLCARAALSTAPSGLNSVERRLSAGIAYSRRVGEFSDVSLAVDYQRTSAVIGDDDVPLEYFQGSVGFNKRLSNSLTLGTFLKYRRREGRDPAGSAQAGINLRFKVGRN